jgi:biotin transport system permease protein
MAEALIFHYRKQNTFLCKANPVTKIAAIIAICVVILSLSLPGLLLTSTALLVATLAQRIPLRSYKRELRYFAFLLLLILITEYLATQSHQAAFSAFLRFVCIILCGLLIADSTSPDDLARSLGSILDRIPFVRGWEVASTIELTLSILPMIFDASLEVVTARKARLERRRNPLHSLTSLAFAIFSLLLDKAEDLSLALEARLFDPSRTRPRLPYTTVDILLSVLVLVLLLFARVL